MLRMKSIPTGIILACLLLGTALASAQTPAPATAPATPSNIIRTTSAHSAPAPTATTLDLPRIIFSLAIIIAAILLLRYAARRFLRLPAAARASESIRILSRTPISPKQHVLALAVGRRVLIVADNGQQLSTLCELTDERELRDFTGRIDSKTPLEPEPQPPPRKQPTPILSPRDELQGLLNKVKGLSQQFK
jgi:flagellar biogenesis protein FliO